MVNCEAANELEVLVVNDGSPDHSREIAYAYQERYPGIVRLIDKENGGHGSTINAAIAAASGEYFRVVDGDDWLNGNALASLIHNLRDKDLRPDVVSSNYYQVYIEDGHTVEWHKEGDSPYYQLIDVASSDLSMEYITIHSAMFRTDLLRKAEFKLQEHTYYVDVEYVLFPIPFIKTVLFAPEHVYRYAVGNPDQSVNETVFLQRYDQHDRVIRRMVEYMQARNMNAGQARYVNSLLLRHLLRSHYLLSLIWDKDKVRGAERAKKFDDFLAEKNPVLYSNVGRRYRAVRQARQAKFSVGLVKRLKSLETGTRGEPIRRRLRHVAGRMARVAARTHLGQQLIATNFGRHLKGRAMRLAGLS